MKITRVRGNYPDRQRFANELKADLYVEIHLNAFRKNPDSLPIFCIVAHNASKESKEAGRHIAAHFTSFWKNLNVPVRYEGAMQVEYGKGGDRNLRTTAMPAVLLECGVVSHLRSALLLQKDGVRWSYAMQLYLALCEAGYSKSHIALSVGHIDQPARVGDEGALVTKKAEPLVFKTEASICEDIANKLMGIVSDLDPIYAPAV